MSEPIWWREFRNDLVERVPNFAPLNRAMLADMQADEAGGVLVLKGGDIPLGSRPLVAYVVARIVEGRLFRGAVVNGDLDVPPRLG